ncbi:MAG: hypothetical protein AB7S38_20805 [Vulcanimicrobiota bacterium]
MLVRSLASRPVRTPARSSLSSHAQPENQPKDPSTSRSRRLEANPLFVAGAAHDEFQLNPANLEFARRQFQLDDGFARLVTQAPEARLSVVYHNSDSGIVVDAYRAAVPAGKDSAFTVYKVTNPEFDPSATYRNELFTPLPGVGFFGSPLTSKQVPVPASAPQGLKDLLKANDFELKATTTEGEFGHTQAFKSYFGLADDFGVEMYQLKNRSFTEKFQVFAQLFRADPEYRVLKISDTLGDVGAALLLGVITPKLWEQGAAYGIASTISSIGNVGSPLVGILGESFLGSVVDRAVNSDRPMENLKKINLATAGLSSVTAACYFALHPQVLQAMPTSPASTFIGLYATSTVASGISGVMSGKASYAIHDQIINKGPHSRPEYTKNFFQILGVEASISRAVYLGSYTGTVALASAFPGISVAMAGTGAALWAGSNFMFSLYHDKPDMKVTVEGSAFVHQGDRYVFDSGWELEFNGQNGRLLKEDDNHYSVEFRQGDLRIKNPDSVDSTHSRRWKDYLPGPLKPKFLGEKEHWELDDGDESVSISRYGDTPYRLESVSDREFVLTSQQ